MFQLLLSTALLVGALADHHPLHSDDYGLPNHHHVNFNTPSNTYEIPDVAAPVLPTFVEVEPAPVTVPSTSYGFPEGPVKLRLPELLKPQTPALVRPQPPKTIEITDSGEIEIELFHEKPTQKPLLEYFLPTTRKPSPVYGVPTKPATEYFVPTTTTTTTRPTTTTTQATTTTTTTTEAPVKPFEVYEAPEKPATEYFVPTTTTEVPTIPFTIYVAPTTTTTTTTTPKPTTTTTTTTTTQKPTTTTEAVYGIPSEKPAVPFNDYGPPKYPSEPFDKVTERPSYPYPAAGVPDLRFQQHNVPFVPQIIGVIPVNPFFRLQGKHVHAVPILLPDYFAL